MGLVCFRVKMNTSFWKIQTYWIEFLSNFSHINLLHSLWCLVGSNYPELLKTASKLHNGVLISKIICYRRQKWEIQAFKNNQWLYCYMHCWCNQKERYGSFFNIVFWWCNIYLHWYYTEIKENHHLNVLRPINFVRNTIFGISCTIYYM